MVSGAAVVLVWTGIEESCTWGVKENGRACATVGVPESTPATGSNVKPGGRLPEGILQLKGVVPPLVWMRVLYSLFKVAGGSAPEDVIERGGAGAMEMEYCGEVTESGVLPLSVTTTVNSSGFCWLPGPLGRPEIVPLILSVRPEGSVPFAAGIVNVRGGTPPVTTMV